MWQLIVREATLLWNERRLVCIVLLFAASAYALLIGNLYKGHVVNRIPVIVCDQDGSAASRRLVRAVTNADQYKVVAVLPEYQTAEKLLNRKKGEAMLVIPQDFSKRLGRGEAIELAFVTDGSNTLYQGYSQSSMQAVAGTFAAEQAASAAMKNGAPELPPVPVSLSIRIKDNPTNSYSFFYLYGVMITAAQLGVTAAFAISQHYDLRKHFFCNRNIIRTLLVKELFYGILSLLSVMIGLTIITGVFHMPFKGQVWQFLLLYLCFVFAVINFSGLVAAYFKTDVAMMQCLVFYALPAFLMSGYIWPELGMIPAWKVISCCVPLHFILADFRDLALSGFSSTLFRHMFILLVMGMAEAAVLWLWHEYKEGESAHVTEIVICLRK